MQKTGMKIVMEFEVPQYVVNFLYAENEITMSMKRYIRKLQKDPTTLIDYYESKVLEDSCIEPDIIKLVKD